MDRLHRKRLTPRLRLREDLLRINHDLRLSHHGQGGEPSRGSFGPVRVKEIRAAAGADFSYFDVPFPKACLKELIATDTPQIEIAGPYHKGPEMIGENLPVSHKLGAAWTE